MEKSRKFSVFKKSYRKTVLDKAVEFLSKDHYELVEKIGSGSFGDVISLKKTFHVKDVDEEVVVVNEKNAGKVILQDMTSLSEFTE